MRKVIYEMIEEHLRQHGRCFRIALSDEVYNAAREQKIVQRISANMFGLLHPRAGMVEVDRESKGAQSKPWKKGRKKRKDAVKPDTVERRHIKTRHA